MNTSTPILELNGLRKNFGEKAAISTISFTLPSGSICALLGRNGAGKTTAIRLIMGQLRPTAGEVRIFGEDAANPSAHNLWRRVGYLAAEPVLYDHLTGREFMQFLAEIHGAPPSRLAELEEQIIALGLATYIDAPIRTYSLGTRKKAAFLASILHDPEVLVLDEPTSSLDPVSARAIRETLRRERERGKLILLSTHRMEEAERIADRVILLHDGELRFDGTPAELRSRFGRNAAESFEDIFIRATGEELRALPDQDDDSVAASAAQEIPR